MTILKTKLQIHEFTLRQEKLKQIGLDNIRIHNEIKTCQNQMKEILQEHVTNFNPNRIQISLSKEHRKILQRSGMLVRYLDLANSYNQNTNLFHSNHRKIKRIRSVDFPDY